MKHRIALEFLRGFVPKSLQDIGRGHFVLYRDRVPLRSMSAEPTDGRLDFQPWLYDSVPPGERDAVLETAKAAILQFGLRMGVQDAWIESIDSCATLITLRPNNPPGESPH